ncbi:S9 family peptidase [Aureibacter tunicatorum]|uniref:Dipeptidyl-peptidase-4 n=1 Tax=Aureibacter tunicatorum TaxID=866807 RepID=A0AAE3XQN5_9BACT|nr:S9 family peptidase [Aureibacter tunicatorum]MDR6239629.1 dipeptidyl-peptidase-4 [Aureibacter tunicatorum]BDD04105.1 peptidase S9 [Aureibacter tunicatorum]
MKNSLILKNWIIILFLFASTSYAQQKDLLLEDIFKNYTFNQKSVYGINWMKDGKFYTTFASLDNGDVAILKKNILSNEVVDTLVTNSELAIFLSNPYFRIQDYSLSSQENQMLISSETESIYRRSSKSYYFIYDLSNNTIQPVSENEKISNATFSPNGKMVAYTKGNNIFIYNIATNNTSQVTNDGEWNKIINGSSDWVYEEEFSIAKAFFWSPDSKKISYFKFNEEDVPVYNMQKWQGLYPKDYKFKYPKAGENNSIVTAHVFNLDNNKTSTINTGSNPDIYLPRMQWTTQDGVLSIIKMNRLQNELEIIHYNAVSEETQTILTETSDTYVDLDFNDKLIYLQNGSFLRTSEKDGFKHIYLHASNGEELQQITSGNWEVSSLIGINEKSKTIYYTSREESPLETTLYSIKTNGKSKKKLSTRKGSNRANFSNDYKYYINYNSAVDQPYYITLHSSNGKMLKVLEDNKNLLSKLNDYKLGKKEFIKIKSDNEELNAYVIYPYNFDENAKYPVLMQVYGGPGSQLVVDSFGRTRDFWHYYLANQGYIIVCVDNRGTGGRGRKFKHSTYKQLGKLETEDQINAAKEISKLPYIDADRIGIWGWSYGGYMSSLCLLKGNNVFKTAIAVAPVTNWRFYDTIYTERYLQTPQDNPSGYDEYSPMFLADRLKGNYFIIHGTGDDNVHFQNSVEMVNQLIKSDKQFNSFYYPDRDHSIRGGNTSMHLYQMMTDYLRNNL